LKFELIGFLIFGGVLSVAIFLPILKKNSHLDNIHITVCNVGSRKLGAWDDYGTKEWGYFAPNLSIYGFDADADACESANAELEERNINWIEKHIPLALGKATEEKTIYVTKNPMCSSLYPPNESYLARFSNLIELAGLDYTIELDVTTLDAFCASEEIQKIDFLQIDVQGADLDVLKGATEVLQRSVLAIQIEVEFSPLYINQPLFADVDSYLRSHNFTLFDIAPAYRSRARSPIISQKRTGQLLWGDAFYFRDLVREDIDISLKNPEEMLKLACIADILDFPDYALEILEYLTLNYGKKQQGYSFYQVITECLSQFPKLVEQGLDSLPIVQSLRDYLI
jgi:FkbM family methyltransferase